MGYETGDIIGGAGKFEGCNDGKNNYCSDEEKMILTNVKCSKDKKTISECGGQ